jgi:hypothetical protein
MRGQVPLMVVGVAFGRSRGASERLLYVVDPCCQDATSDTRRGDTKYTNTARLPNRIRLAREKPVMRLFLHPPSVNARMHESLSASLKPCRSMGNGGIQIGHLDTDIVPIQIVHTRVIQDWSIL